MNKLFLFEDLLKQLGSDNTIPKDFKYIGTGNPNADILIIGKEAAIDPISTDQKEVEISSNFRQWQKIDDFDQSKIKECDCKYHTPLYPYKGQMFKIDNGANCGTSRTWYNYQKLCNLIFGKVGNDKIDFHERVFITEVNSSPSAKTQNAETSSIPFRKKMFHDYEFFQSFPIVIIAGVGYFDISSDQNEIEAIFGVTFNPPKRFAGKASQPYWIHEGTDKPKLLINTRQLSMNVSDLLLKDISELVQFSGLVSN